MSQMSMRMNIEKPITFNRGPQSRVIPSIKVLIVHEIRFMSDIFTEILNDESDITVVGCSTTLEDALQITREMDIDVALVSIRLPNQDSLKLIHEIVNQKPSVKVLALGLPDNKNQALRYIESGASGYILQDSSVSELIESIHLTCRGEAKISTKVAAAVLERLSEMRRAFMQVDPLILDEPRLTQRELEVLDFIGQGYTNKDIATTLVVEIGTVKNHVHNIFKKLDVSNRNEAATYLALMNGHNVE